MKKLTALITLSFFAVVSPAGTEAPVVKSADDLLILLERMISETNWKSKTERKAAGKTIETLKLAYIKDRCGKAPKGCAEEIAVAMARRGYSHESVNSTKTAIASAVAIANNDRLTQNQKQKKINHILANNIIAVPAGKDSIATIIGSWASGAALIGSMVVGGKALEHHKYVRGGICLGIPLGIYTLAELYGND
jgi:hypothetical protein